MVAKATILLAMKEPIRQSDCIAANAVAELAEILAAGLMRLEARKSSRMSDVSGESSLHFTPDQSGHAPDISAEVEA